MLRYDTNTLNYKYLCIFLWFSLEINVITDVPKIRKFKFDENIKEGEVATVMCSASSAMKPIDFKWEKNGQQIAESSENPRIQDGVIHSVLIFDSVKSSDDGNYTCIVTGPSGQDRHSAQLIVKGK